MQCDTFLHYIGAPLMISGPELPVHYYDRDSEFNLHLRAANKIINFAIFFLFFFGILIFKFCFKRKYDQKVACLLDSSIFAFLGDLDQEQLAFNSAISVVKTPDSSRNVNKTMNSAMDLRSTSHPSFDMKEVMMVQRCFEHSLKQHIDYPIERTESQEVYICDFNECCCECCCDFWLNRIYKTQILGRVVGFWNSFEAFFLRQIKSFCFYCVIVGAFISHPVRNIGSFMVNGCNQLLIGYNGWFTLLQISFGSLDLAFAALSLILFLFTVSFLGTRSEFMKTYYFDRGYRARMIYFHFKKAKILGFCYICLRVSFKVVFVEEYPINDSWESPFTLVFVIFINVFLLSCVHFFSGIGLTPIEQDCDILRAHAQYFAIQNSILQRIPRAGELYELIKKQAKEKIPKRYFFANLEKEIERKGMKMTRNLHEELEIIGKQKFKNMMKNTGYTKYMPLLLLWLMVTDLILTLVLSVILLLRAYHPLDNFYNMGHLASIGLSFISIFESTLMPVLIFTCLKKDIYFQRRTSERRKGKSEVDSFNTNCS